MLLQSPRVLGSSWGSTMNQIPMVPRRTRGWGGGEVGTRGSHHEEDPGGGDHQAAVLVGEGLVRLGLPRDGVHPLLLGVLGLELGPDLLLGPHTHT